MRFSTGVLGRTAPHRSGVVGSTAICMTGGSTHAVITYSILSNQAGLTTLDLLLRMLASRHRAPLHHSSYIEYRSCGGQSQKLSCTTAWSVRKSWRSVLTCCINKTVQRRGYPLSAPINCLALSARPKVYSIRMDFMCLRTSVHASTFVSMSATFSLDATVASASAFCATRSCTHK